MEQHRERGLPTEVIDGQEYMVFGSPGGGVPPDDADWKTYKKKVTTRAIRIHGPFKVYTSEGPLTCQDGYLAIDARGYPYPIAVDEFQKIYEEV